MVNTLTRNNRDVKFRFRFKSNAMTHSLLAALQVETQLAEPSRSSGHGSTDMWLVIFTGGLVIVTAGLVLVGVLQYCAMRRQEKWMRVNVKIAERNADIAKQSAHAAESSARASLATIELMQKTAWRELRARVLVASAVRVLPAGAGSFTVEVTIKNWGKVPAYECTFWAEAFLAPSPLSGASIPTPCKPAGAPTMVLPPSGETTLRAFLPAEQYTGQVDAQVQNGNMAVYVLGQIEYRNGFQESCTSKYFMKFGGLDYRSSHFSFCDTGNDAD
jgi:hypothetical protein